MISSMAIQLTWRVTLYLSESRYVQSSHAMFSRVTTEIVLRNAQVWSNNFFPANVSSFFSRYRTIIVNEDVPTATELVFVRRDWSRTRANPKEKDRAEFSSNLPVDNGQDQSFLSGVIHVFWPFNSFYTRRRGGGGGGGEGGKRLQSNLS